MRLPRARQHTPNQRVPSKSAPDLQRWLEMGPCATDSSRAPYLSLSKRENTHKTTMGNVTGSLARPLELEGVY